MPQDSPLRLEVIALLQAAATNSTDEHKTDGVFGAEDLHYFLDIDMAVLGSEPAHYASYTGEVRKEYSFLPDAIYQSLRLKVPIDIMFFSLRMKCTSSFYSNIYYSQNNIRYMQI